MASSTLQIPSIQFGLYYPDIIQALIAYMRVNVPELTDENEYAIAIQLLRAYAAVVHEAHCVADLVAQEGTLASSRLVESVREHLRLIGYELSPATPAKAEIVCKLSKTLVSPVVVVPAGAQFSTVRDAATGLTIFFESDAQVSSTATDELTKILALEAGVYTDYTVEGNSPTTPGDDWSPWATAAAGDQVLFCHSEVMVDRLDTFVTAATGDGGFGVWEHHSGDFTKASPDSVEQVGNKLRMVIDGYLGSENRAGTTIRVQLNSSTVSDDVLSVWTGSQNVVETTGLLGQSEVSLSTGDYTVGSDWEPLPNLSSTSGVGDLYFGTTDQLSWTLPQSVTDSWNTTTIEGTAGYWFRFRWIEAPPASPVVQYVSIDEAGQYVIALVTQGQTITESPLGSSTGAPNQTFQAAQPNFLDDGNDVLLVDALAWTRVDNFILSGPQDEHYVVRLTGDDDTPEIVFGDGVRGKSPAVGVANIDWTYRYGAENDGRVGANTITVDRESLSFVSSVFNPRQAYGWSAAEGATDESLALAKQLGPATLRSCEVAIASSDLPPLTVRFQDDSGAKPYSRAFAIEESFGPGTIELVVVLKGGGLATTPQLDELSLFFNGDKFAVPPVPAHIVANIELTASNYTPKAINVKAVVTVAGAQDLEEEIRNRLLAVLNPEALKEDGVTYEWEFGSEVARSRLSTEIHNVSTAITKVEISEPADDQTLSSQQLPTAGTIEIEIVSPS